MTPRNITTLRVKSDTGNHTYILKMKFQETIRDLRKYIDLHRYRNIHSFHKEKLFCIVRFKISVMKLRIYVNWYRFFLFKSRYYIKIFMLESNVKFLSIFASHWFPFIILIDRSSNSQPYNIVSAYPSKIFDDEKVSLLDAGLTPNAVLHLRVRKWLSFRKPLE